jgi:DNA-binding NtrC family response regulator
VLLVECDADRRRKLVQQLKRHGYIVTSAGDAETALRRARSERFELTILHPLVAGANGVELLRELKTADPEGQVIVVSEHATADDTMKALKLGAFDYLRVPCGFERLLIAMQRACDYARLHRESLALREMVRRDSPDVEIIGESRAMVSLRKQVARFAARDNPVLVEGERGTERELVARSVWAGSSRRVFPFVVVKSSAVPSERLEGELFGHEQGAPGGSAADGQGLFGTIHCGTVFVDEITELDLPLQAKLLRVIEHGELHRAGSTQVQHVDVRVIAGTGRVLEEEIEKGAFKRDLFYRLSVLRITVPPLRERLEDIPLLVKHFLKRLGGAKGPVKEMSDEAVELLEGYHWPGNVRELVNVVERALTISAGPLITADDVRFQLAVTAAAPVSQTLEEVETRHVVRVLGETRGNKSRAAKLLGISRRKLYRLMERFSLDGGGRARASRAARKEIS